MKRTFIAVKSEPGKLLSDSIAEIRNGLSRERIKWEDLSKMHLTLVFIGDTSEATISDIAGMLEDICSTTRSFTFEVTGIGLFRSIHDPKVIWAGIEEFQKLSALQRSITKGLDLLGIPVEGRPFKPHLTIGRIKPAVNRNALEAVINKYKGVSFQKTVVKEVIYYESILRPEGSLYLPIRKYKLED